MYNALLKIMKPFVKLIAKIHAPFSHKKITGKHYYQLRDYIQVGDVFLSRTHGELSNLINPTEIKHGAIYVGRIDSTKVCYVMEAVGKGVVLTDLVSFMTSKDVIVICKPRFIRHTQDVFATLLQKEALRFKGIPYDFLFSSGNSALYCFELVAECFKSVYAEVQLKSNEIVKGKRIYDENTFLDKSFFTVIFDSRKEVIK